MAASAKTIVKVYFTKRMLRTTGNCATRSPNARMRCTTAQSGQRGTCRDGYVCLDIGASAIQVPVFPLNPGWRLASDFCKTFPHSLGRTASLASVSVRPLPVSDQSHVAARKLARKVARRIAAHDVETQTVRTEDVRGLLGRPRVHPEKMAREDQVGIATGMYYTPAGGDIMFVEASLMRGKGELILTGQLGDVMKESARAAWTFARSHAGWLGIDETDFRRDVHIHVPAGAIPKDGPSAGIAMASALVSALSKRAVRNDVSMTGEITISGRVLPIGGLKEKILGAVRAGITTIVIPKDNEADLEDLNEEVRAKLEVHPVETLGEALAVPLYDAVTPNPGNSAPYSAIMPTVNMTATNPNTAANRAAVKGYNLVRTDQVPQDVPKGLRLLQRGMAHDGTLAAAIRALEHE